MAAFVVAYDLHKQGQNYECLVKKLKAYGTQWHMQGSVWIIVTAQSAAQIRDSLLSCLDSNDRLFVGRLSGEAAWHGYSQDSGNWLKARLEGQSA